ncbi:Golgi-associated plant pathogenesis-related protein 1 [Echinococcus granulosus]|uniref:Golgi associated plant pathogenesis n=1 Tax=Echinococcus granulosus TaxID=6210 RepID=A0A068WW20_ECHGR|nr:Golgi-associated plant pathogenesis-related protein 1 [Echinococcus granulosus]CDS24050.1 Golgi associated plant pathogenesis [Echinococcus granulosus]
MAVNTELNEESLFAHNYLRKRHGCPPLEYDEELAKSSQVFADKLAHSPRFRYYYPTDYGENVAYRVSARCAKLSGIDATLRWYREILTYTSGEESQRKYGHFAQVIWKKTKQAGFGMAKSVDGKRVFVVGLELYKKAMDEKAENQESYEAYVKSILDALNSIRRENQLPPLRLNSELIKKRRVDLSGQPGENEDDSNWEDDDKQMKIPRTKLIDPTRIAKLMLKNGQVIRKDITMVGIVTVLMPQSSTVAIAFK